MVNFSLEGKIALVTGASYGIGFGIASAYAEAGATICFNDINQEKVDMGLASYKEKGIEAHGYVCDVTDEEQVKAMVAKIKEEVGVSLINFSARGIRTPAGVPEDTMKILRDAFMNVFQNEELKKTLAAQGIVVELMDWQAYEKYLQTLEDEYKVIGPKYFGWELK